MADTAEAEVSPPPERRLAPIKHRRDRQIQSLHDKLDDLRANSRIVGQVWGGEAHFEQCARWRSRREGIRRRERRRKALRSEKRAERAASIAADAAAAGTSGWLARKEAQLSLQETSLDDDSLQMSDEEIPDDPIREETEAECQARLRQVQRALGVGNGSRSCFPNGAKSALSESSLDVLGQWASTNAEGLSPNWMSHPMRAGRGPVGASSATQPHHVQRTFGRAATETLAMDHTSKHPHNSPMLHGHQEQPEEEKHKEQGGGSVDPGIRYSFARAHRAPDGYQSRGSGCVAIGRSREFRFNSERLAEMLAELTLRCALTKDQTRQVGQQLASFASSGEAFISYGRFIEIAKCAGISETDMSIYKQLFHTFDTNNDAKLDLEELCDGLAYFKRRTLRSKLRLLYTMWCGRHCDEEVDHGGYYEAGLSKFQVYGLIATLMGADLKVAGELRSNVSSTSSSSSSGAAAARPSSVPPVLANVGSSPKGKKKSKSIAAKTEREKELKEAQQASKEISEVELQLVQKLFADIANDNVPSIQLVLAKGAVRSFFDVSSQRTPRPRQKY
jgi:hypothetical protein